MKGSVAVGYLYGEITGNFHTSLINLLAYDAARNGRIIGKGAHMALPCASGRIPEGRNELAERFLKGDWEWLWMVDADMGFAPSTLDRLIDAAHPSKRPVVGALCHGYNPTAKDDCQSITYRAFPTLYRFVETADEAGFAVIDDYPTNRLVKVAGTGAACMVIHREALEKVRAEYGEEWFTPLRHPKGITFSEDLSFCVRVQGVDLPLHVHTGIKTSHAKTVYLTDRHEGVDL